MGLQYKLKKSIIYPKPKIVLICGNAQRELSMLQLLKKEIENTLTADVWIIGSIADIQKIYYLLNRIQPEMVFISQIIENVTRDIAGYVRKSGALLCVLPVEFTFSEADYDQIFNKNQGYNKYLDYYFLTGPKMLNAALRLSDIARSKMFVTGTPKVDLYKNINAKKVLSRTEFIDRYGITQDLKNVFVFTSFPITPLSYLRKQKVLKDKMDLLTKWNRRVIDTRKIYIKDIAKLCIDFPDCNIILKPHPLEDVSYYKEITSKNFYLVDDITFNDVVKSIDLAIYWHSTIATECWISNINVIQYIPVNNFENLESDFTRGNPSIDNYKDLKKGVLKYLHQKLDKKYLNYQKNYLKLCYYKLDGMSAKRVAVKVKDILQNNRSINLTYKPVTSAMMHTFIITEKLLGIKLSRKIISLIKPGYDWKYSVNNFVFIIPS